MGCRRFEDKIRYKLAAHSGDTDDLTLVDFKQKQARSPKDRLMVIRQMNAHAETCDSGDNTLRAAHKAIKNTVAVDDDADEHFVVLLSDANLDQYGIGATELKQIIRAHPKVNVYILFIGTMGEQRRRRLSSSRATWMATRASTWRSSP